MYAPASSNDCMRPLASTQSGGWEHVEETCLSYSPACKKQLGLEDSPCIFPASSPGGDDGYVYMCWFMTFCFIVSASCTCKVSFLPFVQGLVSVRRINLKAWSQLNFSPSGENTQDCMYSLLSATKPARTQRAKDAFHCKASRVSMFQLLILKSGSGAEGSTVSLQSGSRGAGKATAFRATENATSPGFLSWCPAKRTKKIFSLCCKARLVQ